MEEETQFKLEVIDVMIHEDGKSAVGIMYPHKDTKLKIQEIMLGSGSMRKCLLWTDKFLKKDTECRAEILENGRLRIVG